MAEWLSEAEVRKRLVERIDALQPGGQQKVAKAIGVHNSVISACAKGRGRVSDTIADYLGLEMETQRVFREKANG